MAEKSRPRLPENFYWKDDKIWFSVRYKGLRVQKSSGSELIDDAKNARNKLIAKLERGELSGGDPDRVRVNLLLDDYVKSLEHPKRNETSDHHYIVSKQVEAHVRPFFGNMRAIKVRPPVLLDYQRKRLNEGASQNTINHELGYLRSSYYLATACEKFPRNAIPDFVRCGAIDRSATKKGARKRIITEEQLGRLLAELPSHLKPLLVFCWWTGVRRKEALFIRWSQVDFENRTITLRQRETKGGGEEVVPMFQAVHEPLMSWKRHRDEYFPECQWVFCNPRGEQVRDFRTAWRNACLRAGLAEWVTEEATGKKRVVFKVHFHDTRRSAATALHVQYGMDLEHVKALTRHQTDEIALRYIQDEGKIERIRQTVDAAVAGARTGTGAGKGIVDDLRQLAALRLEGALTDEEFTLANARILGGVTAGGYDSGYEKQNAPRAGSAMSANC